MWLQIVMDAQLMGWMWARFICLEWWVSLGFCCGLQTSCHIFAIPMCLHHSLCVWPLWSLPLPLSLSLSLCMCVCACVCWCRWSYWSTFQRAISESISTALHWGMDTHNHPCTSAHTRTHAHTHTHTHTHTHNTQALTHTHATHNLAHLVLYLGWRVVAWIHTYMHTRPVAPAIYINFLQPYLCVWLHVDYLVT